MAQPERINLSESTVLLIDDNPRSLDLLSSLFHGFGVREQIKCDSAQAAVEILKRRQVDLVLVDCSMPEMDGYDLTRWIRRETEAPLRHIPIIMLTGHAAQAQVCKSRDTGASFVVAKPLTPKVLLKRILWLGADEREFVISDGYIGPDRRVRNFGPPLGQAGRRAGDLSAHVGVANEANMDQADIDMLMKPRKVAL